MDGDDGAPPAEKSVCLTQEEAENMLEIEEVSDIDHEIPILTGVTINKSLDDDSAIRQANEDNARLEKLIAEAENEQLAVQRQIQRQQLLLKNAEKWAKLQEQRLANRNAKNQLQTLLKPRLPVSPTKRNTNTNEAGLPCTDSSTSQVPTPPTNDNQGGSNSNSTPDNTKTPGEFHFTLPNIDDEKKAVGGQCNPSLTKAVSDFTGKFVSRTDPWPSPEALQLGNYLCNRFNTAAAKNMDIAINKVVARLSAEGIIYGRSEDHTANYRPRGAKRGNNRGRGGFNNYRGGAT